MFFFCKIQSKYPTSQCNGRRLQDNKHYLCNSFPYVVEWIGLKFLFQIRPPPLIKIMPFMVLLESLFIHMEFGTNSGQFGQGGTLVLPHLTIRLTFPTHTQANPSRSDHFAPRLVSLPRLLKRSKKYRLRGLRSNPLRRSMGYEKWYTSLLSFHKSR